MRRGIIAREEKKKRGRDRENRGRKFIRWEENNWMGSRKNQME